MIWLIIMLIILSLSFSIKIKLNIKQEEAIAIAVFGIIILSYFLGLMNVLWISTYVVGILSFVSSLYVIRKLIKKEENIKELLTLPTLIYILILFVIYVLVNDTQFAYYDEFMFWGTNLKVMLNKSCLWANVQVDGIHLIYPPFTAIAEYLFCRFNGGFHEGVTYFAMITLIFTAVMPLFKKESYCMTSLLKIVFVIALTYFASTLFYYELTNLSVDCILGIIFAVLMYLMYSIKDKKDYLVITILLISITLIKTNGILLAGIVIMQLFFKKVMILFQNKKERKNIKKHISMIGMLLVVIIVTNVSWKLYYTQNGKQIDDRHDKNSVVNIDIAELIKTVTFHERAKERNKEITKRFGEALFHVPITEKSYYRTSIMIVLVVDSLYLLGLVIKKKKQDSISNFLSINLGFFLYLISHLMVFMFVFQKEQGEMLMGFERYVSTYLLAMTLNLIYFLLENSKAKTLILSCLCIGLLQNGLGRKEDRPLIKDITISNAKEIMSQVEETDKVYLIDQSLDYGTEFMQTRFLISPIQTNLLYEWNIGKYHTPGVYYKMVITEEELVKKLREEQYDYLYIIYIDDSFFAEYQHIFSEEAREKLEQMVKQEKWTKGILLKIETDIKDKVEEDKEKISG